MNTTTTRNTAPDWRLAMQGAELFAVECFAAGDTDTGRRALADRARYRDEQMTFAELVASLDRSHD